MMEILDLKPNFYNKSKNISHLFIDKEFLFV